MSLRELATVLQRRRRTIFWVVAVLTSVATLIGLRVTKTYTATAQVMIEPRESQIIDVEKVAQGLAAQDAAILETQIKFIQSRTTLARAFDELNQLNLVEHREFVSERAGAAESVGGPLRLVANWLPEWLAERLAGRWAMAAGVAVNYPLQPDVEALREEAISGLQDGLKVAQSGRSYVLSISYTSTDPHKAAWIANAVARAYIEGQLDEKLSTTRRANLWLAGQVEELRNRVLESENAIEAYRASQGLVDGDGASLGGHQLALLTTSLVEARAEVSAKEARLRHLRELRQSGKGFESSADVLSSPLILTLRQREMELMREEANLSREYGDQHPQILQLRAEQRQLADRIYQEVQNVILNLENEIAVMRSRQHALEEHLNEAKGQSVLTGQAEVQLRELEREAAANRSLYETFLTRLKETEQQQEIVQPDARLISRAMAPQLPSSPSPKLFAMVGFTASIVFGSILALLLEQLDSTLRSTRQAEEVLRLRALGLVPKITGSRHGPLYRHLIDQPRSAYAQGVQTVYTQVRPAARGRRGIILVTSALPGEGKTSLAVSLAAFAAQLGQQILLLDLDLRRPAVARQFGAEREADLRDVLEGRASLEQAIWRDPKTGLDVLAPTEAHDNPITLLSSAQLRALLQEVSDHYDHVVIDTPPVLGLPDLKAISALAEAIVFVVQWKRTKRDAAAAAVKELHEASMELAGVVLAQVDLKKHASYAYGDAAEFYHEFRKYYT